MEILISAVGTTDPISNNRDAALLHIARTYRPEQIVLVYSEEMLVKRDLVEKALCSIEDYHPKVVIESIILKNDEVYLFDKMYEVMGQIIEKIFWNRSSIDLKSLFRDTSDYFCFICLKSN